MSQNWLIVPYPPEKEMTQGFASSGDELKVQAIIKRITPAIRRKDEVAVGRGVRQMTERYGEEIVSTAWTQLMAEHEWLVETAFNGMSREQRHLFTDEAIEVIAQTLQAAGLRLEDHLRVADAGIAVTRQAIEAIKATGYPNAADFGEGNASLEGLGLCRSPFMHSLSEFYPQGAEPGIDEDTMNLWAMASLLISAVMGWLDEPPDEPETALANLKAVVIVAAPTLDLEKLMFRARYDDASLLKLASLTHQGIQAKADLAFER